MTATAETTQDDVQQPLFTCLSCSIGFVTAEDQRVHYRSDHHRYNMKRRVAALPPVSADIFNAKVLQRRADTAVTAPPRGATCAVCSKVYTTEGAYRSHLASRKHKENEGRATARREGGASEPPPAADLPREVAVPTPETAAAVPQNVEDQAEALAPQKVEVSAPQKVEAPAPQIVEEAPAPQPGPSSGPPPDAEGDDDDDEEDALTQTIDAKIAAARARLAPGACLFCAAHASSPADALMHMAREHSFFVPDAEYLIDLPGLLSYLGEKVAVGNVCLFCNGRGREFRTVEAVWKHMTDKGHCKLAYDTERDRLEVSDYYDFSASYPDAVKHGKRAAKVKAVVEEGEWEDVDDDGEADEVIEEEEESAEEDDDDLPDSQITFGDTPYELVLPSGARIGHRAMKRYYAQSFPAPSAAAAADPKSGAAIVRRLLADRRSSDLVPVKGGFGAFGAGTQVVRARNRGEAREAGRHVREFRDQRRKEEYKTRVAFVHNHQKHFRDPLLQ